MRAGTDYRLLRARIKCAPYEEYWVKGDNYNAKEKEEDFRLPLTLGENYSALAAMT